MIVQDRETELKILDLDLYHSWQRVMERPQLKFFNWGVLYEKIYATIEPFFLTKELLQEIVKATFWCNQIYHKVARIITKENTLLHLLGIDPELYPFCRKYNPTVPLTTIGRFDFAIDPEHNIKMLEFNVDTPTGIVEAAELNGVITDIYLLKNPNHKMQSQIKRVFQRTLQGKSFENAVFTSLGWHREDRGTTLAVLKYSGVQGKYLPLDQLQVTKEGLYDEVGRKVDLLWRLYPIELFFKEEEGCQLLDLVLRDKLELLNPPIAFVLQSKAVLCVIWELLNTSFFTPEEKKAVRKYFLPSYLDRDLLPGTAYVKKPAYGREGGGVYIYNERNELVECNHFPDYERTMVYQKKANLYPYTVNTWAGNFQGHLVFGSFVINHSFSGLFIRFGSSITRDDSLYVPVCIKN